jgi:hypothetical protein
MNRIVSEVMIQGIPILNFRTDVAATKGGSSRRGPFRIFLLKPRLSSSIPSTGIRVLSYTHAVVGWEKLRRLDCLRAEHSGSTEPLHDAFCWIFLVLLSALGTKCYIGWLCFRGF